MNIWDVAAKKLDYGRKTCYELETFLKEKGFKDDEIKEVIEDFVEIGYLNDKLYCNDYFTYAFSKGKSKNRAVYELIRKGIPQNIIDIAFEEYEGDTSERERALREGKKILANLDLEEGEPVPEKILARIGRNLKNKGYSSDVIYGVIGELK